MRLSNVRLGHATNSSSSHSIVLLESQARDDLCGCTDMLEYGWENFTLGTSDAKRDYCRVAAFYHYTGLGLGDTEAACLANRAFGGPIVSTELLADSGIDHESIPHFPRPVGETDGMMPLWRWIERNVIEKDRVAILGGNDNEDDHPLSDSGKCFALPWGYEGAVRDHYRWDPQGYIATYNPATGKRLRWCLEDGTPPARSTWPELIDVKIADCCDAGCAHCYQGSTPDGEHAKMDNLHSLAYQSRRMGVFEVALGGGEPTYHPQFAEILRTFHDSGVTPNFSTGSVIWLGDRGLMKAIVECCGSVALSVNSLRGDAVLGARDWLSVAIDSGVPSPALHVILGMQSENVLQCLMDVADRYYARVVLLKYQGGRGRAAATPPFDTEPSWQIVLNSETLKWGRLAVDSFLAAEVAARIPRADPVSYEVGDGRFSMYYDAVAGIAAPHSHASDDQREHVRVHDIERWWQGWQGRQRNAKAMRDLRVSVPADVPARA